MKRLLFVINTMGLAGAEKALIELLRAIPADEYQIDLLSLIDRGELFGQLPEAVRCLNPHPSEGAVLGTEAERFIRKRVMKAALCRLTGVRLLPYLVKNALRMKREGRMQPDKLLWRVLSDGALRTQERYDLAVAYLEGGATYYVADHVNARHKVAFVHIDYVAAGYGPMLDRRCYDAFERICVVSNEVGERFKSVYPEQADKVRLFRNLLDVERIRRLAQSEAVFDDGFTGKRIVSVGRLHPQKAYPNAIAAMKLLIDSGLDLRWYVLGEGTERPALEKLIAENGLTERFLLLGAKSNPYPYIAQADLYVHATRFEGRSIAIEEAQALGKPIIASDCTGNREQITDGVNGLLVQLTPQAVADGIRRLLAHPDEAARLAAHSAYIREDREKDVLDLLRLSEEGHA